jgi:hypothetical protein
VTVAYWVCAAVSLVSAGVSFGFSLAALRERAGAEQTASLYAFSRSTALLAVAVISLFTGSALFVIAVAVAMVIVQAFDAAVGFTQKDRMKTVGPVVVGAVNLVALAWLLTD